MKKTHLAATALAVSSLATGLVLAVSPTHAEAVPATAATQAVNRTHTYVKDARMAGPARGYDVTRVDLYSATSQEPAVALVKFATDQAPGVDGLSVWFNLDDDKEPEAVLHALSYSEYRVVKIKDWAKGGKDITDRNCFKPTLYENVASIEFTPNCFGKSKTMAVSVAGLSGTRRDYAPSKYKWTRRVVSWMSIP